MHSDEVKNTVRDLFSQELLIVIGEKESNMNLMELDIDSLDIMKLAVALEKAFDIKIATSELTEIKTFNDIIK